MAILLRRWNFLKHLGNGTDKHPMIFWLLVFLYFYFPCQFWQSFIFFWGSSEGFVGTPQSCAKIRKFWIFSIFLLCHERFYIYIYIYIYGFRQIYIHDYYMKKMFSQWLWHDGVILLVSYYDIIFTSLVCRTCQF